MDVLRRLGLRKDREPPVPPPEMRELVGRPDAAHYDNPTGRPIFSEYVPDTAYDSVFDLGCGCGRISRQLMQQKARPKRYLGVDINRSMVEWCRDNLTPSNKDFRFMHHDVYSPSLAPENARRLTALIEAEDSAFSLAAALSIFTHLYEAQAVHYLGEVSRMLRSDGWMISTWFLFDKREFPMMQPFQNTLFINENDPTNAVIYDREWLLKAVSEAGLEVVAVKPPEIRGFHWWITMRPKGPGVEPADFPEDEAPYGSMPPPLLPPRRSSEPQANKEEHS